MRALGLLLILGLSLAVLAAARPADADEPPGVTLEALPQPEAGEGQESIVLSARLMSAGEPVAGVPVTFYVVTTIFGERLMKVGETLSDATGTASILYRPTWEGDHTAVARFGGNSEYPATQTSFNFDVTEAFSPWEPAQFGLEPMRRWLPAAVGIAVLAVLGALGYALVTAVIGIPAAAGNAPAKAPLPAWDPRVQRPAPLGKALLGMAVLLAVAAIPAAWLIGEARKPDDVNLSTQGGSFEHDGMTGGDSTGRDPSDLPAPEPLAGTLVSSTPMTTFDSGGQPAPGSVAMPADVAVSAGRIRILDATMGRILTLTPEGRLAAILDAGNYGGLSLKGAPAMTPYGPELFVATADGRIVVVNSAGEIEGVINPVVPAGEYPLVPGGIALADSGVIWISDAANHRVLALNDRGEYGLVIGEGVPSAKPEGFNTPGGIAIGEDGNVYVTDTGNGVVKRFSPLGVLLQTIGEGRLAQPSAAAVGDDGTIFVSDESARLVSAFAPDGRYMGSFGGDYLQQPHSLKADEGRVYVMDRLAGLFIFEPAAEAAYAGGP